MIYKVYKIFIINSEDFDKTIDTLISIGFKNTNENVFKGFRKSIIYIDVEDSTFYSSDGYGLEKTILLKEFVKLINEHRGEITFNKLNLL